MPAEQPTQQLTYAQAIRQGLEQAMERDSRVILIGEGVPDPKAIFGTTAGLREKFGSDRVFDMPLSENGMTGICIGAALNGMRPVMVHQRIDFALLAMDQLVNNAAKWHYMFDGKARIPMVVRVIVGRGWGQGPQHSQSLQSMFGHVPGLKVVMPSTPYDAKGMLISAIDDDNPVIFIEHRWLHHISDAVPAPEYRVQLGQPRVLHHGTRMTIAGYSYAVLEALHVARKLSAFGVDVEVIDMRTVRPMDETMLFESVRKTGKLMVVDTGWPSCGMASELIARVALREFASLKRAPVRVTLPDHPAPTSPHMTDGYYPTEKTIFEGVMEMLDNPLNSSDRELLIAAIQRDGPADVPQRSFAGPF